MEKEIYKDIPGYEGYYQISNLGRVKSIERKVSRGSYTIIQKERILKPSKTGKKGNEYYNVILWKDRKTKGYRVHQLVAMAFMDHTRDGFNYIVDHKNNNRFDNRLENLQIINVRENLSKDKGIGSSKYPGVLWDKEREKWKASIYQNGKRKFLGRYDSEVEAYEAYKSQV